MINLESVRGLYEAFGKGDVPTVLAFWTLAESIRGFMSEQTK